MDPDNDPRWRVFLSHTAELRTYPASGSYVAAVERAIAAAGHVIVDMTDFAATDTTASDLCVEKVQGCDVYVGILGLRYGSPVRARPDISYTELEFDTATTAGKDRLVFLMNPNSDELGMPATALIDREHGTRQDAFRQRVKDAGLTVQSFDNPDQLGHLVERALRELAATRQRISSGITREQQPPDPLPDRGSKLINPAPVTAPTWFQGRKAETLLMANFLADPAMRLLTVIGRGGIGKTALVCRLLKGLEAGKLPDVDPDQAQLPVDGIVYLSPNGRHHVDYPNLVGDLSRLLPAEVAKGLDGLYQDPHNTPTQVILALLEAFPAGGRVVVLLDNIESVMDAEHESLTETALHDALATLLRAPEHAVKVIVTTRVTPSDLMRVQPASQHALRLDEGLGAGDAENVLRALDTDGYLGLRDAPDALLASVRDRTRGFPRALEAVKAILSNDPSLTVADVLERTSDVPTDEIVEALVGEAYEGLDEPAQQVMQALAVYPTPVSPVGVDFLLQPYNPTINAAPILTRLVRRELVRHDAGNYYLHPIDRAYALTRVPQGAPDDERPIQTLTAMRARAARYYTRIRTPRSSWRTLDDIRPQLAEFDLRCENADFNTAATVLADIDAEYLRRWGHYRTVLEMRLRIHDQISDLALKGNHLGSLGHCYQGLDEYLKAGALHEEALRIFREAGNRHGEANAQSGLADCYFTVGNYPKAIALDEEALSIHRQNGSRHGEASCLGGLANCHSRLGDHLKALALQEESLRIFREIGHRRGEAGSIGNLGICNYRLGDHLRAIALQEEALSIHRQTGDRRGEGIALCNLANSRTVLGDFLKAIALQEESLQIHRQTGGRQGEANVLCDLGTCYTKLGDYPKAIALQGESLRISLETGSRQVEGAGLTSLANGWLAAGNTALAIELFEDAMRVADGSGDAESRTQARSGLARARLQDDDARAALSLTAAARVISFPIEHARLWLLEGVALVRLNRPKEAARAFLEAVVEANGMLDMAAQNTDALDTKGLACCGLAVTGDVARVGEAVECFAKARGIHTAAGVIADALRLNALLAAHDPKGILAGVPEAIRGTR